MSNERTDDYSTYSNKEGNACNSSGMTSENEKKKTHESSEMTRNLNLDTTSDGGLALATYSSCGQDASSGLTEVVSKISECVVSLASYKGDHFHFAYSGIVVDVDSFRTSVLTSANVIRSLDHSNMMADFSIYVLLPNGEMVLGWTRDIDYDLNIAIVNFRTVPGLREARLDHHMQSGYNSNVVALGRDFLSGDLTYSTGAVTNRSSLRYGGSRIATCKFVESGIGGALFDSEGNFVGSNVFFKSSEGTYFIPKEKILKFLEPFGIPRINQGSDNTSERSPGSSSEKSQSTNHTSSVPSASDSESESESDSGRQSGRDLESDSEIDSENESSEEVAFYDFPDYRPLPENEFTKALIDDLNTRGYPLPKTLDEGMHLRYSFEEEFARDTWSKLPHKVAYNTSLSVVSLASFKGSKERYFACTGVLIGRHKCTTSILTSASLVTNADDENMVDNKLEIQVYLPNKKCVKGKLKHCDLQYNIAVVTIKGHHCRRTAKIYAKESAEPHNGVVAIGRTFETGKLMATSGILTTESTELDCNELAFSTCKITKAGIGGPLIDLNGNFIGMNFYGAKRTPYVPRHIILEQLRRFDGKGAAAAIDNPRPNRWHVRKPKWYYPSAEPRDNWPSRKLL